MREWVATQWPDADIRIAVARGQATEWDRDGLEDGLEPDEIAILDAIRARAETTWMVDATECDDANMAAAGAIPRHVRRPSLYTL